MAHRLTHIIPIYGPYMSHTTQFGKGIAEYSRISPNYFCTILYDAKLAIWEPNGTYYVSNINAVILFIRKDMLNFFLS